MTINLELPIKFGQKISGHICQGHVDTVGVVKSVSNIDKSNSIMKTFSLVNHHLNIHIYVKLLL